MPVLLSLHMFHSMVTKRGNRLETSEPVARTPAWRLRSDIGDVLARTGKPGEPLGLICPRDRTFELYPQDSDVRSLQENFLSEGLRNPAAFASFITSNERFRNLLRVADTVSRGDEAVLITGETGVGKELLARAIHHASQRRGSFVALNVAALEETVFDDTLFGHLKGAFTGADQPRKGLAAAAEGGTLFLDEVGDLKPQSQVKLLRFLESGEYLPLGSDASRYSSARLIVATNCDLHLQVDRGTFRTDLFYRLSTFHLMVPSLRQRLEDIPLLCDSLLTSFTPAGEKVPRLTPEALQVLKSLPYPGNVRELRQILLRAKVASTNGMIDLSTL